MQFRNLDEQYKKLKPRIDSAIQSVLDEGRYIGGEQVGLLGHELADYVGVKNCITCGNGTDALQLALMAWEVGEGLAVFVPDFTFFSSGEVVSAVGATPVFVDVDRDTFNIDPDKLEESICYIRENTDLRPAVVVAVDLFGLPADYSRLETICESNDLLLLEDGAQGFGGSFNGKKACSFGDVSTTSFFPAKPLGCYGDGGAIFTNDDNLANLIRSLAVHGKGSMKYDNVRIGMNSRLDTLQAAILEVKLDAFIESELESVNKLADEYTERLKNLEDAGFLALPSVPSGFTSSWAQYTIKLPSTESREMLRSKLRGVDIPSMVYYPKPMHEQKAFADKCICLDGCPTTCELCGTVLSIPIGPYLNNADLIRVSSAIENAFVG